MNARKTKLIRKQTLYILYAWVKSLLSKEEADKLLDEEEIKLLN